MTHLKGSMIREENITNGYGIAEFDGRKFETGQYVFELVMNDIRVATNKFQVMK